MNLDSKKLNVKEIDINEQKAYNGGQIAVILGGLAILFGVSVVFNLAVHYTVAGIKAGVNHLYHKVVDHKGATPTIA